MSGDRSGDRARLSGDGARSPARVERGSTCKRLPDGRATASDGVNIAVHDLGGTGAPVVFAHATGFHGLVWQQAGALLAQDFHAIGLDHRGHGNSALPPDRDYDWRGFGRDILAVIDHLGLVQPFGVGHSAGGTAMLLAEQARPGTFRALFLFEPVLVRADPPLGRDPANWLAEGARRRREVFDSREEAYATYASKPPFMTWVPEVLAAYVDYGFGDRADGTVSLKCRPDDEAVVYERATEHDAFVHLGEISCPVMLVAGAANDSFGPGTDIAALADRLADGRSENLPGVGHFGPMEDPPAVAALIRRFFRGVMTGESATPPD
ncbi:MAG: alpha/beta hydrolase [Actinomycetota bacterium]|nr:alpha/beta hydrolase [Actinomycetota bacterium]MDQ6947678.1 alpha/beta hydrolase [Actinomycetota bacterium]